MEFRMCDILSWFTQNVTHSNHTHITTWAHIPLMVERIAFHSVHQCLLRSTKSYVIATFRRFVKKMEMMFPVAFLPHQMVIHALNLLILFDSRIQRGQRASSWQSQSKYSLESFWRMSEWFFRRIRAKADNEFVKRIKSSLTWDNGTWLSYSRCV